MTKLQWGPLSKALKNTIRTQSQHNREYSQKHNDSLTSQSNPFPLANLRPPMRPIGVVALPVALVYLAGL